MRHATALAFTVILASNALAQEAGKQDKPLPLGANYGFLPPEIYKLDRGIKGLILRDLNNDGLTDAIVINSAKNRIDVLQQRKDIKDRTGEETPNESNEIVSDWRLRHIKIPALRQIDSLEVADVNGDKIPDLVYIGDPPGLYVEYQKADGTFGRRKTFEVPDVQHSSWMLDVGDLNGDGRNDIAFLGKGNLYIVYQKADSSLDQPLKYRLTDENPALIRIIDLDGDGLKDVVYITEDQQFPVRARFQTKDHRLGPERRFAADKPRGITWANVDGKPGTDLLMISDLTDRLQVYRLGQPDNDDPPPTSQIVTFPFEKSGSASNNDLAIADFSGDGMVDVAVCDSDGARIFLYRQLPGEGLDLGTAFPAMQGIKSLRAVPVTTAEKVQLLALSDKENVIGVSSFRDNRLSYPQPLTTSFEPQAMEVVGTGAATKLYYVTRSREKGEKFFLRCLAATVQGDATTWTTANIGKEPQLALELPGKPSDLKTVDVNGDGIADLLVLFDFQAPVLLLGQADGGFTPTQAGGQNNVGDIAAAAVFFGPLDGPKPELLLAQGNFARKMQYTDGRWKVIDAINASDSTAAIVGIAALDLDGDGKKELAMYDRTSKSLLFLKYKEGVYRQWKQLKVGSFGLRGMRVADFDHDGKDDLLLFDADKMGIVYTGKQDLELKQIASYETNIRGGKLEDVAAGDLSGKGKSDMLLIDMNQHNLEIVTMMPDNKIERAVRWPVFEEKTFRQNFGGREPREVAVGDLNHDGLADIAVVVHNRVLVYLQDAGTPAATTSASAGANSSKALGGISPTPKQRLKFQTPIR